MKRKVSNHVDWFYCEMDCFEELLKRCDEAKRRLEEKKVNVGKRKLASEERNREVDLEESLQKNEEKHREHARYRTSRERIKMKLFIITIKMMKKILSKEASFLPLTEKGSRSRWILIFVAQKCFQMWMAAVERNVTHGPDVDSCRCCARSRSDENQSEDSISKAQYALKVACVSVLIDILIKPLHGN